MHSKGGENPVCSQVYLHGRPVPDSAHLQQNLHVLRIGQRPGPRSPLKAEKDNYVGGVPAYYAAGGVGDKGHLGVECDS